MVCDLYLCRPSVSWTLFPHLIARMTFSSTATWCRPTIDFHLSSNVVLCTLSFRSDRCSMALPSSLRRYLHRKASQPGAKRHDALKRHPLLGKGNGASKVSKKRHRRHTTQVRPHIWNPMCSRIALTDSSLNYHRSTSVTVSYCCCRPRYAIEFGTSPSSELRVSK